MGTVHALLTIRQNMGTNGCLGIPKYHYKRRERLRRKGEDFWRGEKLSIKFCKIRENWGKYNNIASWYPVKATIAHTWIKKESNFASLEGWNNYSRL